MIEKIDLQGSTAIIMANKIAKICLPLRNINISEFQYLNYTPAGSWRVEESWLEAGVILKKCSPSHSLDEHPHDCPNKH